MRRTTLAALGLAASAAALNAALARAAATAPAFTDAALAAAVVELPVDRSVLDLTLTSESVDGSRSDAISPDRRVLTLASDVLFAFGSADLTADAATRLAATAAAAQGSGSTAAIDGYTDAVGDPAANLALSERRATAVLDALRPQLPGLAFTVREDSDCTRGWHRRRMLTVPLPGVDPGAALQQVRAAGLACQNARSGGGNAGDRYNQYLRWASETAASLGYVLRPSDVDQLVATPRHWALQGLDPTSNGNAASLVDLELVERGRALTAAAELLAIAVARRETAAGPLVVPDTNVVLRPGNPFREADWPGLVPGGDLGVALVVPLQVVDELDRLKRTGKEYKDDDGRTIAVRTLARTALRTLGSLLPEPAARTALRPGSPAVTVELLMDPPGHARLPDPDAEIVDRALALQDLLGLPVIVATLDLGMSLRARAAGLGVVGD